MEKPTVISVVGQTATGKTAFSLKLADQLLDKDKKKIVLLSADSKQIFQGLEILTGADVPTDFQPTKQTNLTYPFFINADKNIELHGIACVPGDSDWSVAHFQRLFQELYGRLDNQSALIIVGGTGLYHQQIFQPAATTDIKPDLKLRQQLEKLSLDQLQNKLQQAWPERWEKMNHSDQHNPRRLIRAIEVAQTQPTNLTKSSIQPDQQFGLQLPLETLARKIAERVEERLANGVIEEIKKFEKTYSTGAIQAKTSLGFSEIDQYLESKFTLKELKQAWALAEIQYAKRQQTWWKKRPNIQWLTN